jgi:cytochrome c551/c552
MAWAKDGSLFLGETNRGWGSAGDANQGLQRLVWNNKVPFEMRAVRAMPDGFEIEFTKPVDIKYAEDISSYSVESFIYKYQAVYGSPPVNTKACAVKGVKVSADGMKARIVVDNLRPHYIHTITLDGVRDKENYYSLVHPTAYYTLNSIPAGNKLSLMEVNTKSSGKGTKGTAPKKVAVPAKSGTADPSITTTKKPGAKAISYAGVQPLLTKYTCVSCHNPTKKQVGPAFVDVAKRKYSIERIVQLIHNPEPKNWPDYAVAMPPMPQVPDADARKIAAWIRSLQ